MVKFIDVFPNPKPVIGMIHLAGNTLDDKVERAVDELTIYEEKGVDGVIFENYYGDMKDLYEAMRVIKKRGSSLAVGVNALGDVLRGFILADEYGGSFVQVDSVQPRDFGLDEWANIRQQYSNLAVLGGVRFKYSRDTDRTLPDSIRVAKERCDAIVTTGEGTGFETPLDKLREFKIVAPDFPIIAGAGVNPRNVYDTLLACDGVIVGTSFKPGSPSMPHGDTRLPVEHKRVGDLMSEVYRVRDDL